MGFDHAQEEDGLCAITADEAPRDSFVLRFIHETQERLVAEEKGEWGAIAFREENREGDDGAGVVVMLKRLLQGPHLAIGIAGVKGAIILRGDDEGEGIGATVAIDIFEAVAKLRAGLEVIEQARIGIDAGKAKAEDGWEEGGGDRGHDKAVRPETARRFERSHSGFARYGPGQKWRIHEIGADK